jgi:ethanolamine ammonia-lyase small subunit
VAEHSPAAPSPGVTPEPWEELRRFTPARLALGRAGVSLPTSEVLRLSLDHARARDAVTRPLDAPPLFSALSGLGLPLLELRSQARDQREYLLRPDLGRRLDPESAARLRDLALAEQSPPPDLALVLSEGLSSLAVERQAAPFLAEFLPLAAARGWRLAPPVLVRRGRVAVGDEVGELLRARAVAVLIGERPGLSVPDSLGAYLTWNPRVGLTDERRNCISNIRPEGLPFTRAARTLDYLLDQALTRGLSGVELKDEFDATAVPADGPLT